MSNQNSRIFSLKTEIVIFRLFLPNTPFLGAGIPNMKSVLREKNSKYEKRESCHTLEVTGMERLRYRVTPGIRIEFGVN